jgi:hypothetical protein
MVASSIFVTSNAMKMNGFPLLGGDGKVISKTVTSN